MVRKPLMYGREHTSLLTRHQRYRVLLSPGRRGLTQTRDLTDAPDKNKQCSKHLMHSVDLTCQCCPCAWFEDSDIFDSMLCLIVEMQRGRLVSPELYLSKRGNIIWIEEVLLAPFEKLLYGGPEGAKYNIKLIKLTRQQHRKHNNTTTPFLKACQLQRKPV